jgi:Phage-related baseplate assembly protein
MPNSTVRQYPEINFVNTDTEALVNNMIQAYEIIAGRKLYPADPTRIFILWIADIITQERVIINESAKQNVPRYAEGEYLDSLAELFKDTERLKPKPAVTTLRFYLSAPQTSAQIIPRGTRATVGGEITFETTEAAHILPGESYGEAPAICQEMGESGNGFPRGQIRELVDIYPFYERVENVTTSEGGADTETDAHFYERLRDSMEAFSTAGSVGSYIYWVKTASQKIADVKPISPEPGVVDIRVLLENGEFPDLEMIQLIHNTLNGKVPMTDTVNVSEPDTRLFDVDIVYYIPRQTADSAATVKANAEKSIEAYLKWQTEKMGRDINPDELRYRLKAAGVKRVELAAPAYTIVSENEVAARGKINAIYGGIEDE